MRDMFKALIVSGLLVFFIVFPIERKALGWIIGLSTALCEYPCHDGWVLRCYPTVSPPRCVCIPEW
jgi:hypothetical protein